MTISNEQIQALQAAAEKATPGKWIHDGEGEIKTLVNKVDLARVWSDLCNRNNDAEFIATANPAAILSLLAERDADKKRIAELEARTVSVKLPKTIWYEHDDLARDVAVLEKRLVKKALREACAAAGIKLEVGE